MVWKFKEADWNKLKKELKETQSADMDTMKVDEAAEFLTQRILKAAEDSIPRATMREKKSTYPWVNDKVVDLVGKKMVEVE